MRAAKMSGSELHATLMSVTMVMCVSPAIVKLFNP